MGPERLGNPLVRPVFRLLHAVFKEDSPKETFWLRFPPSQGSDRLSEDAFF